ncbi:hypothetical protein AQUCO_00201248v1 [Aquilegia coerulea]|uniref:Protein kinase domain-containing protein n=1 Tax=Aquilegia coerulea TaxID=218851 RepID=A0A2G5F6Y9_AQUCA|nr:hypothetical protein AQUCO_00201248v1 [Aquilegia coerulea]
MAQSVDVILDFLRRNRFARAEAALLGELSNRPDLNASFQKPQNDLLEREEEEEGEEDKLVGNASGGSWSSSGGSKELIVKEIECGTGRNGAESKWRVASVGDQKKPNELVRKNEKKFTFGQELEDSSSDLYSWKIDPSNGLVGLPQKDSATISSSFSELQISDQSNKHPVIGDGGEATKLDLLGDQKLLWPGSTSKGNADLKLGTKRISEHKELEQESKPFGLYSKDNSADITWSKIKETTEPSLDPWKDCSVKTVFPSPMEDANDYRKEGKKKAESISNAAILNQQMNEFGKSLFLGNSQANLEQKNMVSFDYLHLIENHKEELPRLPPVKLKSEDKPASVHWEEKFDHHGPGAKMTSLENNLLIGSHLDVPVGQEINSLGDGLSDYPGEYWDSDEYDDDDDIGYMRQPIEDETWFLAHEIDYPSDNERATGHGSVPDQQERGPAKDEDDEQSFAEEDSYFSGEQYFQSKNIEQVAAPDDPIGHSMAEMYRRNDESDLVAQYDGQLMDEEELNLMRSEPVWQGFVTQPNDFIMLGNGRVLNEYERPRPDDLCIDDDQHGSVRSIGVGISSDAADIGSEVRESLVGGSSEGELEYFRDQDVGISGSRHSQSDTEKRFIDRINRDKGRTGTQNSDKYILGHEKAVSASGANHTEAGFSFPPPRRAGDPLQVESSKSLWSSKHNAVTEDELIDCENDLVVNDDTLATWKRKNSDSSPVKSCRDESNITAVKATPLLDYGGLEREHLIEGEDDRASDAREEDPATTLEDEEAAAVQEQVRQIKAQEEEFETFNLKIVHRKNRTGFEEDKNFHVVLNSVIAGRYHVTEYLGSAAFSKAIQAHDLHTGMDVCVKIIKNNKDFFDQSLDEIKLLKFVNKNDPGDKYHLLRLYDYFYYREHLLIVCELLKANLYEFHKFNRESGGEVYFTMPRLQSITIQCLEALQFLHGLGLIHCDLKPENILVKSYSRCEVKVIDLGSSCFQTDHLCSYVQSRSYRAPEVILGLPYDKKIDIWSLGCILAELCTGNVLFQNDSPATLLARVIGIIGSIDQGMLAKGRDTYKYFTKNHMLYERNQDTNRLEYLIPKKSSLRHRLPMGDEGFVDFVAHLLEVNPKKRPTASEALKHHWLSYPYEPISS